MIPLAGTSTGSAGKASPHLQAWLDEKKAAEEKRRQLEGDTSMLCPNLYSSQYLQFQLPIYDTVVISKKGKR